jgi:hypothetical protein
VTRNSSKRLAGILRETVRCLQQGPDIGPDDRALLELKRDLLLKIAALEADAAPSAADTDEVRPTLHAACRHRA